MEANGTICRWRWGGQWRALFPQTSLWNTSHWSWKSFPLKGKQVASYKPLCAACGDQARHLHGCTIVKVVGQGIPKSPFWGRAIPRWPLWAGLWSLRIPCMTLCSTAVFWTSWPLVTTARNPFLCISGSPWLALSSSAKCFIICFIPSYSSMSRSPFPTIL